MRERRPADWVRDLGGRHDLERLVERSLAEHSHLRLLRTSTSAFDRLDFQLVGPGARLVELELKAKLQPLSTGWRALRPDVDPADVFVLDELALRKIVDAGRYAFLLLRDLPLARWVLWSAGDLVVATRVRATRRLDTGPVSKSKGKLLLNMSEASLSVSTLPAALDALADTVIRLDARWSDIAPWPAAGGNP
jgi:hypothetical protein